MSGYIPKLLFASTVTCVFFALLGSALIDLARIRFGTLAHWLIAPAAGAAAWAGGSFFLMSVFGLSGALTWGLALVLVAGAAARHIMADGPTITAPVALIGAGLFVVSILALVPVLPSFYEGGLYFGAPMFDHIKVALVDSIFHRGLPPVSPFLALDGQPVALNYYYGWYVMAAELRWIYGLSGIAADGALTHITAAVSLLLIAGLAAWVSGSALAALGTAVLVPLLGFAPILRAIRNTFLGAHIAPQPSFVPDGWLSQVAWAPQHAFAATCVLLAFTLCVAMVAGGRERWRAIPLLALAWAGAASCSIWAGAAPLVVAGVPLIIVFLARRDSRAGVLRSLPAFAVAALLTLGLIAPYVQHLLHLRTEDAPAMLAPALFPAIASLPTNTPLGFVANLLGFWLYLLPLGYGLVLVLGIVGLMMTKRQDAADLRLFRVAALTLALACLITAQSVRSLVGNNDFGWRVVLPAGYVLGVFAAVAFARLVACARASATPSRPRWILAGIGATVLVLAVPTVRFSAGHFLEFPSDPAVLEQHQAFNLQRGAWRSIRRQTAPTDLVLNNPATAPNVTPWPANAGWALFSDRASPLGYPTWASTMAVHVPERAILDLAAFVARVFSGSAAPADIDRLADQMKVRALVVTPTDGLWQNAAVLAPRYQMVVDTPHFRVFLKPAAPRTVPGAH